MKRRALLLGSMLVTTALSAQKPPIDANAYAMWRSIGRAAISNDGKFVCYSIENQPVGSHTLVLQASQGTWKREVAGAVPVADCFTNDSRRALFTKAGDSLGLAMLGGSAIEYLPHVTSVNVPAQGTGDWLAYQVNAPVAALVVRHLATGSQRSFPNARDYAVSEDGSVLVLHTRSPAGGVAVEALQWVDLMDGSPATIWRGRGARNLVLDARHAQVAFAVDDTVQGRRATSFWYYKAGMSDARQLVDDASAAAGHGLLLESISRFSRAGDRLFVRLQEPEAPEPGPDAVPVHVWSYADRQLQSRQRDELEPRSFVAVIDLQDRRLVRLQREDESFEEQAARGNDAFGIVKRRVGGPSEDIWNPSIAYLVSTKDGTRKQITDLRFVWVQAPLASPEGKYLLYWDYKQEAFFSYEVASGRTRQVTRRIRTAWQAYDPQLPLGAPYLVDQPAGWLKDDAAVLLQNESDLWLVDLAGKAAPVNVTNGYGRRHQIVFRLALDRQGAPIGATDTLLLSAFDRRTKETGFYRIVLGKGGDPERLTMGPYLYHIPDNGSILDISPFPPLKARNAEMYLVRRMSATESPNYFSTTDFKTFTPLSDLHPEREYNWLTAELVSWRALDGRTLQGVLYKPENFDPGRKYPLIFNYYERKSDGLNAYLKPEALHAGCEINVPSYVSRGYLVFSPDIHFTMGETGESARNAVVSAAKHLAKMPWVDGRKMGINGCSFGGFITNYLVTRTDLFAAAASASGSADLISHYGGLRGGVSMHGIFERGQNRIGTSLWERPDLYVENSPVFRADEVTTPLLLMHTTQDGVVPFAQAVEFFTALRRLGKKAWLLQYDDGDHGVWGKSGSDFGIRLAQFFDHYLRGAPPPEWMTQGIPAKPKGAERLPTARGTNR